MRGARLGVVLGFVICLLLYTAQVTIQGPAVYPLGPKHVRAVEKDEHGKQGAPTRAGAVHGAPQTKAGAPRGAGTEPGVRAPAWVVFNASSGKADRRRCLRAAPFQFQPLVRKEEFDWRIMSLVQSVRLDGPSGLPMRCDWVVGTRMSHWRKIAPNTAFGDLDAKPRTVFVMTENRQAFHDHILPCLDADERFVLIVGDNDMTTPRQLDVRYRYEPDVKLFSPKAASTTNFKYAAWLAWLRDPRIVHIFVEHLDEKALAKVSPIPVGLNPQEMSRGVMRLSAEDMAKRFTAAPLASRPLKARFMHRIRNGIGQWALRAKTRVACDTKWKDTCVSGAPVHGDGYYHEIAKYPFLICAHGGGIDPNPSLWSALLVGTIPIIERFASDSMYRDLPVVVLQDLPNANLSRGQLQIWRDSLGKMFEGRDHRRVLQRLSSDYWWNQVMSKVHLHATTTPAPMAHR